MAERWKPIADYEGQYEVSNLGRVKSLARTYTGVSNNKPVIKPLRERVLRPVKVAGYWTVQLCRGGIPIRFYVHRLVASAFVRNPLQLNEVNHLDSCRTNNHWSNLEWTTRAGNLLHAGAKGHMGRPKLTTAKVRSIRAAVAAGRTQTSVARVHGVTPSDVSALVRRATWKHVD
jgi:hypothetical protein